MDQERLDCECREALDEQNALLAGEHMGCLVVMMSKLHLPLYQIGNDLELGGCVVAGGGFQRYKDFLYVFSVHIEPFESGRVVSWIEVFDLSGIDGLPADDPAQRMAQHRMLTDPKRGDALRKIYASIACDRSRVLIRYERADIEEDWMLAVDTLYQRLDGNTYRVGDTFSHDQLLSFITTFTLIPAITNAGPPQSIIVITT